MCVYLHRAQVELAGASANPSLKMIVLDSDTITVAGASANHTGNQVRIRTK